MFRQVETNGFSDLRYYGEPQAAGRVVYVLTGPIGRHPTQTSIQIAPNSHIEDSLGRYINHACQPNVKIVGCNLVALKPIKNGDSITFNYNASEDRMSNPFVCNCCKKWIKGKFS